MKIKYVLLLTSSLLLAALYLQQTAATTTEIAPAPAREMRGAWMATVLNIDYPQRPTLDAATLQADFRSQLFRLKAIGINAVFVQVRAAADAIYPSKYAPWSQWVSGRQGMAPASNFDPLAFMIDEAHAKGMEFHAWVNPYRVTMNLDTFNLAPDNIFFQHRNWVKQYGNRLYLDPGIPEVQDHLLDVTEELLMNYRLDGIHFDDYFYPYPVTGETFPDRETFDLYGTRFETREDWRRDNVNTLVTRISQLVERKKPWVQYGISPFGVWRNQSRDPIGSATRAFASSYDDLYGDALAWARDGVVDYLAPQLYWNIGFAAADYAHLLGWWTKNVNPKTRIYVGHAAYKVGTDPEPAWNDLEELPRQINLNRQNPRIAGSLYFSTKSLLTSPVGLDQRLKDIYASLILLPEQSGAYGNAPQAPEVEKTKLTSDGPLIVWEVAKDVPDNDLPYYYSIYRTSSTGFTELIHVTPFDQGCRRYHFYDKSLSGQSINGTTYEVRAVDKWHRESSKSVAEADSIGTIPLALK